MPKKNDEREEEERSVYLSTALCNLALLLDHDTPEGVHRKEFKCQYKKPFREGVQFLVCFAIALVLIYHLSLIHCSSCRLPRFRETAWSQGIGIGDILPSPLLPLLRLLRQPTHSRSLLVARNRVEWQLYLCLDLAGLRVATIAVVLVVGLGRRPCEICTLFLVQRLFFSPAARGRRLDQMGLRHILVTECEAPDFGVCPACA